MTIGIVGYGYVGKAMVEYYQSHYAVIWYDPFIAGSCTKEEINQCSLVVICVPTNSLANGSCDLSIVDSVLNWIITADTCGPLILLKSTVPIGTTDYFNKKYQQSIVFSPEYIGESEYDTGSYDFNKCISKSPFFIFGGQPAEVAQIVNIHQRISGPSKIYHQTTALAAEIAKYMENAFLACKLVFCYEFAQICQRFGCDYNIVRELWLADPRIGKSHTCVFPTNSCPFAGKCLPKDLAAVINVAQENGYEAKFLAEIKKSNERIGRLLKDSQK